MYIGADGAASPPCYVTLGNVPGATRLNQPAVRVRLQHGQLLLMVGDAVFTTPHQVAGAVGTKSVRLVFTWA